MSFNEIANRTEEQTPFNAEEPGAPAQAQTPHAKKLHISGGNVLLAALFAAGIGCVYFMSLRNGPQQASAEMSRNESQVEGVLAQYSSLTVARDAKKTATIVESFYLEARKRQVPVDKLAGNPFAFVPVPEAVQAAAVIKTPEPAPKEDSKQVQLAKALADVKQLSLTSILTGNGGSTAIINNNILTEGQTIAGWTVTKITSDEVTLNFSDQKYTLKMK